MDKFHYFKNTSISHVKLPKALKKEVGKNVFYGCNGLRVRNTNICCNNLKKSEIV